MGARAYVRHTESGAVKEVAASALRILVRSGWQELNAAEVEALHDERRAERAAVEAAMTPDRDQPATTRATETRTSVSVDAVTENSAAPEGDDGEHDDTAPELGRRQDTEQESD